MGQIRTVGHGTLPAATFAQITSATGIQTIVDVRRFPGSRRHPHFGSDAMGSWLPAAGIGYRWLPSLGGRREPDPGSPNTGLRNAQFRAYGDHMAGAEFREGIDRLLAVAADQAVAVMCAEAVWWRCHRRLLADHLVLVEATPVEHLFHDGRLAAHPVTPEARPAGDHVVYDRDLGGS